MWIEGSHVVSARSHLPSEDGDPFRPRQHHPFRLSLPMHQNQITMSKRRSAHLLHLQTKPRERDRGLGQTQRIASVADHRQVVLDPHPALTGIAEGGRVVTRVQDATVENLKFLMILSTEARVVVEADLRGESPLQEAPSGFSTGRRAQLKAGLTGRDR